MAVTIKINRAYNIQSGVDNENLLYQSTKGAKIIFKTASKKALHKNERIKFEKIVSFACNK